MNNFQRNVEKSFLIGNIFLHFVMRLLETT
jgi:hypothetical protein